jgi:hypothetical protein
VVSVRLRDPAAALTTPEEPSDAPAEPAFQEA